MWLTTVSLLLFLSIGITTADVNSDVIVQKFLDRMWSSINTKNNAVYSGLLEPGFKFKGCKGVYDRPEIYQMLYRVSMQRLYFREKRFELKSSKDLGDTIKYTVLMRGFDSTPYDAEFVLNKRDQKLESGRRISCPTRKVRESSSSKTADDLAFSFISNLEEAFKSSPEDNYREGLLKYFDAYFMIKNCLGSYIYKGEFIDKVKKLHIKNPKKIINIYLDHAWFRSDGLIEFEAKIEEYIFDFKFVYDHQRNVLISGELIECPQ